MIEWLFKMFCKQESVEEQAMKLWRVHALLREGKRNDVYLDSRSKLTVGIGHLVLKKDNLKFGDIIDDERIDSFFENDSAIALSLAKEQAKEIGIYTPEFIATMISVNFQLGNFSKVFYGTYPLLVSGDYRQAVQNLKRSLWYKQTPVRVFDLINSIEKEFV